MGRKLKEISSKVFTLSYPRYRFFVFLGVLVLLRVIPFSVVEGTKNFSVCSRVFGDYCFSVGVTRGVSSLLRGDFQLGVNFNFLSIPVLIILVGFLIHDFWKGFLRNKE